MPILAAILSGLASFASGLLAMFGRKLSVATAAITAMFALTAAFVICISLTVQAIANIIVLPSFLAPIGWFVPSDFTFCISSIISARTCRAAYDLAMAKVRLINSAS